MLLQTARHLEDLADWQHLCPSTIKERPHHSKTQCFHRHCQSFSSINQSIFVYSWQKWHSRTYVYTCKYNRAHWDIHNRLETYRISFSYSFSALKLQICQFRPSFVFGIFVFSSFVFVPVSFSVHRHFRLSPKPKEVFVSCKMSRIFVCIRWIGHA